MFYVQSEDVLPRFPASYDHTVLNITGSSLVEKGAAMKEKFESFMLYDLSEARFAATGTRGTAESSYIAAVQKVQSSGMKLREKYFPTDLSRHGEGGRQLKLTVASLPSIVGPTPEITEYMQEVKGYWKAIKESHGLMRMGHEHESPPVDTAQKEAVQDFNRVRLNTSMKPLFYRETGRANLPYIIRDYRTDMPQAFGTTGFSKYVPFQLYGTAVQDLNTYAQEYSSLKPRNAWNSNVEGANDIISRASEAYGDGFDRRLYNTFLYNGDYRAAADSVLTRLNLAIMHSRKMKKRHANVDFDMDDSRVGSLSYVPEDKFKKGGEVDKLYYYEKGEFTRALNYLDRELPDEMKYRLFGLKGIKVFKRSVRERLLAGAFGVDMGGIIAPIILNSAYTFSHAPYSIAEDFVLQREVGVDFNFLPPEVDSTDSENEYGEESEIPKLPPPPLNVEEAADYLAAAEVLSSISRPSKKYRTTDPAEEIYARAVQYIETVIKERLTKHDKHRGFFDIVKPVARRPYPDAFTYYNQLDQGFRITQLNHNLGYYDPPPPASEAIKKAYLFAEHDYHRSGNIWTVTEEEMYMEEEKEEEIKEEGVVEQVYTSSIHNGEEFSGVVEDENLKSVVNYQVEMVNEIYKEMVDDFNYVNNELDDEEGRSIARARQAIDRSRIIMKKNQHSMNMRLNYRFSYDADKVNQFDAIVSTTRRLHAALQKIDNPDNGIDFTQNFREYAEEGAFLGSRYFSMILNDTKLEELALTNYYGPQGDNAAADNTDETFMNTLIRNYRRDENFWGVERAGIVYDIVARDNGSLLRAATNTSGLRLAVYELLNGGYDDGAGGAPLADKIYVGREILRGQPYADNFFAMYDKAKKLMQYPGSSTHKGLRSSIEMFKETDMSNNGDMITYLYNFEEDTFLHPRVLTESGLFISANGNKFVEKENDWYKTRLDKAVEYISAKTFDIDKLNREQSVGKELRLTLQKHAVQGAYMMFGALPYVSQESNATVAYLVRGLTTDSLPTYIMNVNHYLKAVHEHTYNLMLQEHHSTVAAKNQYLLDSQGDVEKGKMEETKIKKDVVKELKVYNTRMFNVLQGYVGALTTLKYAGKIGVKEHDDVLAKFTDLEYKAAPGIITDFSKDFASVYRKISNIYSSALNKASREYDVQLAIHEKTVAGQDELVNSIKKSATTLTAFTNFNKDKWGYSVNESMRFAVAAMSKVGNDPKLIEYVFAKIGEGFNTIVVEYERKYKLIAESMSERNFIHGELLKIVPEIYETTTPEYLSGVVNSFVSYSEHLQKMRSRQADSYQRLSQLKYEINYETVSNREKADELRDAILKSQYHLETDLQIEAKLKEVREPSSGTITNQVLYEAVSAIAGATHWRTLADLQDSVSHMTQPLKNANGERMTADDVIKLTITKQAQVLTKAYAKVYEREQTIDILQGYLREKGNELAEAKRKKAHLIERHKAEEDFANQQVVYQKYATDTREKQLKEALAVAGSGSSGSGSIAPSAAAAQLADQTHLFKLYYRHQEVLTMNQEIYNKQLAKMKVINDITEASTALTKIRDTTTYEARLRSYQVDSYKDQISTLGERVRQYTALVDTMQAAKTLFSQYKRYLIERVEAHTGLRNVSAGQLEQSLNYIGGALQYMNDAKYKIDDLEKEVKDEKRKIKDLENVPSLDFANPENRVQHKYLANFMAEMNTVNNSAQQVYILEAIDNVNSGLSMGLYSGSPYQVQNLYHMSVMMHVMDKNFKKLQEERATYINDLNGYRAGLVRYMALVPAGQRAAEPYRELERQKKQLEIKYSNFVVDAAQLYTYQASISTMLNPFFDNENLIGMSARVRYAVIDRPVHQKIVLSIIDDNDQQVADMRINPSVDQLSVRDRQDWATIKEATHYVNLDIRGFSEDLRRESGISKASVRVEAFEERFRLLEESFTANYSSAKDFITGKAIAYPQASQWLLENTDTTGTMLHISKILKDERVQMMEQEESGRYRELFANASLSKNIGQVMDQYRTERVNNIVSGKIQAAQTQNDEIAYRKMFVEKLANHIVVSDPAGAVGHLTGLLQSGYYEGLYSVMINEDVDSVFMSKANMKIVHKELLDAGKLLPALHSRESFEKTFLHSVKLMQTQIPIKDETFREIITDNLTPSYITTMASRLSKVQKLLTLQQESTFESYINKSMQRVNIKRLGIFEALKLQKGFDVEPATLEVIKGTVEYQVLIVKRTIDNIEAEFAEDLIYKGARKIAEREEAEEAKEEVKDDEFNVADIAVRVDPIAAARRRPMIDIDIPDNDANEMMVADEVVVKEEEVKGGLLERLGVEYERPVQQPFVVVRRVDRNKWANKILEVKYLRYGGDTIKAKFDHLAANAVKLEEMQSKIIEARVHGKNGDGEDAQEAAAKLFNEMGDDVGYAFDKSVLDNDKEVIEYIGEYVAQAEQAAITLAKEYQFANGRDNEHVKKSFVRYMELETSAQFYTQIMLIAQEEYALSKASMIEEERYQALLEKGEIDELPINTLAHFQHMTIAMELMGQGMEMAEKLESVLRTPKKDGRVSATNLVYANRFAKMNDFFATQLNDAAKTYGEHLQKDFERETLKEYEADRALEKEEDKNMVGKIRDEMEKKTTEYLKSLDSVSESKGVGKGLLHGLQGSGDVQKGNPMQRLKDMSLNNAVGFEKLSRKQKHEHQRKFVSERALLLNNPRETFRKLQSNRDTMTVLNAHPEMMKKYKILESANDLRGSFYMANIHSLTKAFLDLRKRYSDRQYSYSHFHERTAKTAARSQPSNTTTAWNYHKAKGDMEAASKKMLASRHRKRIMDKYHPIIEDMAKSTSTLAKVFIS